MAKVKRCNTKCCRTVAGNNDLGFLDASIPEKWSGTPTSDMRSETICLNFQKSQAKMFQQVFEVTKALQQISNIYSYFCSNNMKECLKEIEGCDRRLFGIRTKLEEQVQPVREMQKVYQEKMSEFEDFLYKTVNRYEFYD